MEIFDVGIEGIPEWDIVPLIFRVLNRPVAQIVGFKRPREIDDEIKNYEVIEEDYINTPFNPGFSVEFRLT